MLNRRLRAMAGALIGGALLIGAVAAPVSAAPRPLTMDIFIGDYAVGGTVRNNAYIQVTVRNAAGELLGKGLADTYDGQWYFGSFSGVLQPGYTIKATVFNTHGTLETRQVTIPLITIGANRATDVVSGKAPAGTSVDVEVADFRWDYWGESYDQLDSATVSPSGTWSVDFGNEGINVRGGAEAAVSWFNSSHTVHVLRYVYVPRLYVGVGQSDFGGGTTRNHGVKVTLKDNAANVLATGTAVGNYIDGEFGGVLADADGEPYTVQGGEHLKASAIGPDVNWKIPTGISSVDVATDKVSGQCFPNGRYEVYALDPDTFEEALDFGDAAANGSFTKDMTPDMNIRANTYVEVDCWTPEGDIAWSYRGTYPGGFSSKQAVKQAVKHLIKRA